jgi:flagellar protein FlbD
VIILTRLGIGTPVAVNPDIIERAEATPDTVVTLLDGHKLVVTESVDELVHLVRTWRAEVAADAYAINRERRRVTVAMERDDDQAVEEHSAHDTMARVLRLPRRES